MSSQENKTGEQRRLLLLLRKRDVIKIIALVGNGNLDLEQRRRRRRRQQHHQQQQQQLLPVGYTWTTTEAATESRKEKPSGNLPRTTNRRTMRAHYMRS